METRRGSDQHDIGLFLFQHFGVVRVRIGHIELLAEFASAGGINVACGDELDSALGEFDCTHMRFANSTRADENGAVCFHTEILLGFLYGQWSLSRCVDG